MAAPSTPVSLVRRVVAAAGVERTAPTPAVHAFSALLLVGMLVATSVRTSRFEVPQGPLLVAVLLAWLPLLVRTRFPLPVLLAVVAVESAHIALLTAIRPDALAPELMGAFQPAPLATMVAAYTVAAHAPRAVGWVAGVGAGTALLAVALLTQSLQLLATDVVVLNLVVIATAVGVAVATSRDRLRRARLEREEDTRQAVHDERLRIARELHDVLAHNLTLVNAQAAVADYLLPRDPAAAATALRDITTHTGRAIDELRATVGLLRETGTTDAANGSDGPLEPDGLRPVPGLARLDELVASFRQAGAIVDLTVTGEPVELDQQTDLAAYRIVQEALTNATKHAPDTPIEVLLAWSDDELRVHVSNPVTDAGLRRRAPGTGHGLIGMRERARSAGGRLWAGPSPDGSFAVRAGLPVAGGTTGRAGVTT